MEKEQWKDDVLNSLQGIRRAEPDSDLYARVQERLAAPIQVVRRPYAALAAACLVALIIGNIWALRSRSMDSPVADQIDITRFDLYE